MPHSVDASPLGKVTHYISTYSPQLLFAIARAPKWTELGLTADRLPYYGADIWNCYELSWLLPSGKPVVAVGEFQIPADSPNIIESKSFKLYLNSLNQSVFENTGQLIRTLEQDLSAVAGKPVQVRIYSLRDVQQQGLQLLPGDCVDELDIRIESCATPQPGLLRCDRQQVTRACLSSHLLKSNCPVTGQPDWGSIVVEYSGYWLDPGSFLAYLVSYRQHADFHEQCVERIFLDLQQLLCPEQLTVYARYVRRGGLDINPFRSTHPGLPANGRLARQ